MSIGTNIAKYRKAKGFTQEKLGNLIGVTNQAVSKWESETAMPDVLLIPKIAEALSVTLEEIYDYKSTADTFPNEAHNKLINLFYNNCGIRFNNVSKDNTKQIEYYMEQLLNGAVLLYRSNIDGSVFIDNNFAFIDKGYKNTIENGLFHLLPRINKVFHVLNDSNCIKVLEYQFKTSVDSDTEHNIEFSVDDVAKNLNLSQSETIKALEDLVDININERCCFKNNIVAYYFKKSEAIYCVAILKLANILLSDKSYLVVRDNSIINQHTFHQMKENE